MAIMSEPGHLAHAQSLRLHLVPLAQAHPEVGRGVGPEHAIPLELIRLEASDGLGPEATLRDLMVSPGPKVVSTRAQQDPGGASRKALGAAGCLQEDPSLE